MANFMVIAPLSEDYRQALVKAYSDAESGKPFTLPDGMAKSRESHFQYLQQLKAEGKLLFAGPIADFSAALLLFEGITREELEQIMQGEPHIRNGFMANWEIKEWLRRF